MAPLRWVCVRKDAKCDLWKLEKPLPDGRIATFYRGRLLETDSAERTRQPEEAKFTAQKAALAWFEAHRARGGTSQLPGSEKSKK
jgi:hypothetical protein